MEDKLRFEDCGKSNVSSTVLRVNGQAAAALFDLVDKTGRPISEIASRAIVWAAGRVELTERKMYDMHFPEV